MKKSYMNINNILSEGFFDKIKKIFNGKPVSKEDKAKLDKTVKTMNSHISDMEQYLNKMSGEKVSFKRVTAQDFYK